MPTHDEPVRGSCLCGAVRYSVAGPLKQVIGCHCRECRKNTGHLLAFTAAWKDQLEIQGADSLGWYRSSDHSRRGFCRTCGSPLFFDTDGSERISITAGSLDRSPEIGPLAAHLFVSEKAGYYALDDDAPQYERGGDRVPMPPRE
jgi:hypothetical protein